MKELKFGISTIRDDNGPYFIAEIGHNHKGSLEIALKMIKVAAECGINAVKFQKRDNKSLFTKVYYNRIYDNENSYGKTYGEHREFLEFGKKEYIELMKCAKEHNIEFMSTAFDFNSVDFLEELGISSIKIASADITNIQLIEYAAKLNKPLFISTGACTLEEVKNAYNTVLKYHNKLCVLHCVAGYPVEYENLNLKIIETLKKELSEAIIGYSGHDNGILAPIIAYMLGARVIEKHFTLNHAWKGTDHKFSLEPPGLHKQIRDLKRVDLSLGSSEKIILDLEKEPRNKMGKSLYASKDLEAGTILKEDDLCIKSPGGGLFPYEINKVLNKKLKVFLNEEDMIKLEDLDG